MFKRLIEWLYAKTHFRPTGTHGEVCGLCGCRINDLHGNPAKWGTWLPSDKQDSNQNCGHTNTEYFHAFCLKDHMNMMGATITQLMSTRSNSDKESA